MWVVPIVNFLCIIFEFSFFKITFRTKYTFHFHSKYFTSFHWQNINNTNFRNVSLLFPRTICCYSNFSNLLIIYEINNNFSGLLISVNLLKLLAASFKTFFLPIIDLELNILTILLHDFAVTRGGRYKIPVIFIMSVKPVPWKLA